MHLDRNLLHTPPDEVALPESLIDIQYQDHTIGPIKSQQELVDAY